MQVTKMSCTFHKIAGLAGEKIEKRVGFKRIHLISYGF